jgi:hypothetical protein
MQIPVQPEAVAMARDTVSRVVAERQADRGRWRTSGS